MLSSTITYFSIAFGLVFQPLGNEGLRWRKIQLHFNLYTGPGFFIAFMSIINILVLIFLFKEFNVHGTKRKIPLKEICRWCSRVAKREEKGAKMARMDNSMSELCSLLFTVFQFGCIFKVVGLVI